MQILKQAEEGVPVADLCREYGMSTASIYKWRSKYGGMDVAMLTEMKAMAEKNKRLKRMYAESQMQNELLKEGHTRKKVVKPSQRKVMVQWAAQDKSVSIVLACATFGISETCYRYRSVLSDENEEIADWLLRLTTCHKPGALAFATCICAM